MIQKIGTIRTLALGALLALGTAACTDDSGLDRGNNAVPLTPETRITATANSAGIGTVGTRTTSADDANAPTPQNCLAGGEKTLAMLAEAGKNSFVLLAPEMQHDYKADATTTTGTNYQCLFATPTAVKDDKGIVTGLSFAFTTVDGDGDPGVFLTDGLRAKYLNPNATDAVKNRAYLITKSENNYYATADRKGGSNYAFALRNAKTKVSVTLTDKETGNAINQTADAAKAITVQLTNIGQISENIVYREGENDPWKELEDPTADLSDVTDIRRLTTTNGDNLTTTPLTNATRTEGTDKKTTHIWNTLIAPQTFDGVRANAALVITLPAGAASNVSELTFSKKLSEISVTNADGTGNAKLADVKENEHLILRITLDGLHDLTVSATLEEWTIATAAYGSSTNTDDANYELETEDFNGGKRYLIRNATDLQLFANMVNTNTGTAEEPAYGNANARVTADFTFRLTDEWTGIGTFAAYLGTFDGDGHTLHLTGSGKSGLFRNIGSDGVVKNLSTDGGSFTTTIINCGTIADTNNGGIVENCHVANAAVKPQVSSAGSVVGYNYGTIRACSAIACEVEGNYNSGTVVGDNNGTVSACYAYACTVGGTPSNKIAGSGIIASIAVTDDNLALLNSTELYDGNTNISGTIPAAGTPKGGLAILNTDKITLSDNNAYYWAPGTGKNATPVLTLVPTSMEIANTRDLCLFALLVNAGNGWINATLANDISMKSIGVWKAIGNGDNYYQGTLEGAGHVLLDFAPATMVANGDHAGFFGYTGGTVQNLTLHRGGFTLTEKVNLAGALAGRGAGILTNCHVEEFVIRANIDYNYHLGSLVGSSAANATACTATRCSVTNTATTNANVGGLAGTATRTLTACAAYACTVVNSDQTDSKTGGLVGSNQATLTACIATPAVLTGSNLTGYMVGYISNANSKVLTCAYGKCSGASNEIGGTSGSGTATGNFWLYSGTSGALAEGAINTLNNAISSSTVSSINKEWQWTTIGARPVKRL